jgi:hypothetical protein
MQSQGHACSSRQCPSSSSRRVLTQPGVGPSGTAAAVLTSLGLPRQHHSRRVATWLLGLWCVPHAGQLLLQ